MTENTAGPAHPQFGAVAQDPATLEQVAVQEATAIEGEVQKDMTAWDAAVNAGVELGHRAEDVIGLLEHLWSRGVAVIMHSQPAASSGSSGAENPPVSV